MTTIPSSLRRRSWLASSRALTASGSDEAATSKRRWIALDTLLTFCPPAPWARTALISTSASSTTTLTGAVLTIPPGCDAKSLANHPHRHPRRPRAHQLVADGAGRLGDLVDRQYRAVVGPPPEGGDAADARCGHGREVDGDHVHRDPADGARAHAVDQHRRAPVVPSRRQPRIAVGVAAGDDADPHLPLGEVSGAVADAGARRHRLHRD